jgi:hypothetical protein
MMTKCVRFGSLFLIMTMISIAPIVGTAQEKKTTKAPKAATSGGYVELKETKTGRIYFSIRTEEGKFLAGSAPTGLANKEEVEKVLSQIKAAIESGKVVEPKKAD